MAGYRFRVRFRIEDGVVLAEGGAEREIADTCHGTYVLRAGAEGQAIKDAKWLVLKGPVFRSREDARLYGERAKDALRWCAARLGVGVDAGQDWATGWFTDHGKTWAKSVFGLDAEACLLDDVHGLCVHEDTPGLRFVRISADPKLNKSAAAFEDAFRDALESGMALTDDLRRAFDSYAASHFLTMPGARHSAVTDGPRLLLLWGALDALAHATGQGAELRETATVSHIDELIELTRRADLSSGDAPPVRYAALPQARSKPPDGQDVRWGRRRRRRGAVLPLPIGSDPWEEQGARRAAARLSPVGAPCR